MKSQSFRRKPSTIRGFEEPKKKKKIKWEKLFYSTLLILILLYFFRLLLIKLTLIRADGQVHFNKVDIQFYENVRIDALLVEEGDTVKKGDSLLKYTIEEAIGANGLTQELSRAYHKELQNLAEERREFIQKLRIKETELKQLQQQYAKYKAQKSQVKDQVYLGIETVNELRPIDRTLDNLTFKISVLKEEINTLNWMLQTAEQGTSLAPRELLYGDQADNLRPSSFLHRAPIEGIVTDVQKSQYEIALISDVVMSIHQPEYVCIKAFFEPEDIKHIEVGDEVNIKFPEGKKSVGIISKIYAATQELPEEFQKKYEPTHRSIAVDIMPKDEEELKEWRGLYKMGVKISKLKFF